jgi:LDH2 family malate/lactate/ureidoglycolate dehydrogenase
MALDPRAFRPEGGFEDDLDAAIDFLRAVEPIDAREPVLVPGDPESASAKERGETGIPISLALAGTIQAICGRCGAAFMLDA